MPVVIEDATKLLVSVGIGVSGGISVAVSLLMSIGIVVPLEFLGSGESSANDCWLELQPNKKIDNIMTLPNWLNNSALFRITLIKIFLKDICFFT